MAHSQCPFGGGGKWRKWEQVLEFQPGMFDHKIEQSCWGMFFRGPYIITHQIHMGEASLIHAILVFPRSLKPFLERCTHVRTHTCLSLKRIALLGCSCSESRHRTTLVQVGCWGCTSAWWATLEASEMLCLSHKPVASARFTWACSSLLGSRPESVIYSYGKFAYAKNYAKSLFGTWFYGPSSKSP